MTRGRFGGHVPLLPPPPLGSGTDVSGKYKLHPAEKNE